MPPAKRILLVGDDPLLSASLSEQLEKGGHFHTVRAASLGQARAFLAQGGFAAVIADQNLPDGEGESLARALRREGLMLPVLLLADGPGSSDTGATAASERIAKPFRFADLLARLGAHLGRHVPDDAPLRIGPYIFRPAAKLLVDARRQIRLTEKETNILCFLHAAPGVVPRQTLLHEVWGYNPAVTTHTLETHIYRLRRKIEENPGQARLLITEDGGYRLAG